MGLRRWARDDAWPWLDSAVEEGLKLKGKWVVGAVSLGLGAFLGGFFSQLLKQVPGTIYGIVAGALFWFFLGAIRVHAKNREKPFVGSLSLKVDSVGTHLNVTVTAHGAKAKNVETILRRSDGASQPLRVWPYGIELIEGEESRIYEPTMYYEPSAGGDLVVHTVPIPGTPRFSLERVGLGDFVFTTEAESGQKDSKRFNVSAKGEMLVLTPLD
jgi:hypothetical protein